MSGMVSKPVAGPALPTLRLASYPDSNPGNPYVDLFNAAMAQHGIEHAGRVVPDPVWLDEGGRIVDVVHIHWPERIWRGKHRGRLDHVLAWCSGRSIRGVWQLRRFLALAGQCGITRVWTVHNVAHHEGASPIDRWGYRELARRADLLLCFSHAAAEAIRREYGSGLPILVISHGSYKGAYPPPGAQAETRARLGLRADLPVVSCLGLLRPYKGLELACDAVESMNHRVQLLIAGQPNRAFDIDGLIARAEASHGSIVVLPRVLTDAEFSDAVGASDAIVLPYHAVTGSGVLFAAWTLGAGVIASDLPFFREMLDGRPLAGRTFHVGDSAALADAITSYLDVPVEERRRGIDALVDALSPEHIVGPFVEALRRRHPVARASAASASGRI
jgi:glycosyltransferase involved in cell wall biosynthesis